MAAPPKPVGANVASVGYNFRDAPVQMARAHGMKVGKIIRSPVDKLVNYHV
jgi:hypothetical protein